MKKFILPLFLISFALSQWTVNEKLFLDIEADFLSFLPNRNPAYLNNEVMPYSYAFTYRYDNNAGDYRLPFTPSGKSYQNIAVSAFREMKSGVIFAGRFAYRYEQRKDKKWLHNAENHLHIPFYFADSSTGDFILNGIDWNMLFSYPLSKNIHAGLNIFYNVDEQFKSVFPKPNIKRNSVHIHPALAFSAEHSRLGLRGSFFQYKQDMDTKRYRLEQGKTPTFMRIHGLDKPLMTYAKTSEERLQNIRGWGLSADMDLARILMFKTNYEYAKTDITDGGAYPVPQGRWDITRFYYRADLYPGCKANLFFQQQISRSEGFHPDLDRRIYARSYRQSKGGLTIPYRQSNGEMWSGTVSYAFEEVKREDNFLGLLDYFPSNSLYLGMRYDHERKFLQYGFNIAYENIDVGQEIIYNDITGWYYTEITEKEIAYYRQDRRKISASLRLLFPLGSNQFEISASCTAVRPKNIAKSYHFAQTRLTMLF